MSGRLLVSAVPVKRKDEFWTIQTFMGSSGGRHVSDSVSNCVGGAGISSEH